MAKKKKMQKKVGTAPTKARAKAGRRDTVRAAAKQKSGRAPDAGKRAQTAKAETQATRVKSPLGKKDLAAYREKLQALRDRVIDEINFLTGDNLNCSQRDASGDLSAHSFHMADQGTDNFDREFALNLASSEQDTLYEIDEALARIETKTFGVCEGCGCAIEKARLDAMPYTRMCVKCKSQSEKGKARYRPFGPTLSQTIPPE